MKSNTIYLSILACALAAGCELGTTGEIDDSGEEEPGGAELEQTESVGSGGPVMERDCMLSCPTGWHPIGYYCNGCGGYTCSEAYDSLICEKDRSPKFDKCGLGCPTGYVDGPYYCSNECIASGRGWCDFANTQRCFAMPAIEDIVDVAGQTPIRVGQPISIWGQRFEPGGSLVRMHQRQGNVWHQWFLPLDDGSWWWNGNETQINTIVPPGVEANNTLYIQIQTSEAQNELVMITPAPAP
jgi:hypothetical protein